MAYRRTHFIWDDFQWYISPHLWTSLAADGGTSLAIATGAGGILALTTGATDNNETAVKTTNSPFLMAANAPLIYEARIQWTEANTDDANVAVGLCDSAGANLLVDDGAGPKTSYSGAMLYKVDGSNVWKFNSSKSTTQTTSTSAIAAGGSAYQVARIEFRPYSTTALWAVPFIDAGDGLGMQQLVDATTGIKIKHSVTFASAAAMQPFAYNKAGAANSEVLNVDYIGCAQLRI